MRRWLALALALITGAALAGSVMAATWYKVGDGCCTHSDVARLYDHRRIQFNSIVVDPAGNVFATTNKNGLHGCVTIFRKTGQIVCVDFDQLGITGSVTKLVVAGDGLVYGLMNWLEISWGYAVPSGGPYVPARIIRILPNGAVTIIKEYSPVTVDGNTNWTNRITGISVGSDGNVYWLMNGNDNYWKYHWFWRYDVAADVVEEYPNTGTNNGWSEAHRFFDLEATVNKGTSVGQWFACIKSGNQTWRADPFSWTDNRVVSANCDPGWGRDHCTATWYDAAHNKLWTGARGASNRCILNRWNNFSATDGQPATCDMWHALNNDSDLGVIWWTWGLAVDNAGDAWMSFGAGNNTSTIFGYRNHVVRRDLYLGLTDEGVPQQGSDVCALGYDAATDTVYATAVDLTTGAFTIWRNKQVQQPLTVTINQAATQADPTSDSPINFTVVFSAPVTDFATGDVTLSGTAGATIGQVTGSGTTYNVAVSGMQRCGTVIATIAPGVAHDAFGTPNQASTSTDNMVTFVSSGTTIPQAKALPNGQAVCLAKKPVTAVFTNSFYVEEYARDMGIEVKPGVMPAGIAVGHVADIVGTIATDANGERVVIGAASSAPSAVAPVAPVGMNNRAVGGGDWQYNAGTGAGQKGVVGGAGLNNIGLLIRTWGQYTQLSPTTFLVNDGSTTGPIKCVVPSGVLLSPNWPFVVVTGVISCEQPVVGSLTPLVKVRQQSDIAL